jgi:tRNA U34 2-thiouridine synthase MnmA/TrmU
VVGTDAAANTVTVGTRDELATTHVTVRHAVLHRPAAAVDAVKLRYRAQPVPCRVREALEPGRHPRLELELAEPVDGATPGQVACLMAGDVVLGWGTIGAGASPRLPP